MRDPIHGFIHLDLFPFVKDVIDSESFQRLKRLSQLGVSYITYPTATHSRFSHSLGAMHVFHRLYSRLLEMEGKSKDEREYLLKLGCASMLLHDIGHGPFSHVSEKALDADRLDYLPRDAYFTGVGFGNIDLERMMNILAIHHSATFLDGYAISVPKGKYSIESYLLTRHLMYEGVYYHKATRSAEIILRKIIERAKDAREGSLFLPKELRFIGEKRKPEMKDIIELDDAVLVYAIRQWMKSKDGVLADLSRRFINRNLLKCVELSPKKLRAYYEQEFSKIEKLATKEMPFDYYFQIDSPADTAYQPYTIEEKGQQSPITSIFVYNDDGEPREISRESKVIEAISGTEYTDRLFFPASVRSEVANVLK